jgi:septal ring factor EnvC (AmiA/AmiB activator)
LESALDKTKRRHTEVELQLLEINKKIQKLKQDNSKMRTLVEQRLRALREMGTLGVLNVLFASETLTELMARETSLRLILNHDRATRLKYAEKLKVLEDEEERVQSRLDELATLEKNIKETARELEKSREERRQLYGKLESESREYATMIEEMKDARRSLQGIISNLVKSVEQAERMRAEVAAEKTRMRAGTYSVGARRGAGASSGFGGSMGHLITPAPGIVVVPAFDYSAQGPTGVVFACPWGSRIKAVYDGTVVYKKTLPGYGNTIIIDHGDRFFTLTSQAIRFFKQPGDKVFEGEVIGLSGGGPWVEEGIYFEIRHGDIQENPLEWLDLRGVKVVSGH